MGRWELRGRSRISAQGCHRTNDDQSANKRRSKNPAIVEAVDLALKNGTALHLMGLVSDGGVHATTITL